ncbi:MAG: ABC transporter substrate-binding protein [Actinomycetia bacterium]|nr:ABC transporter substrate-binding protein [Actinomycetes bacterium]
MKMSSSQRFLPLLLFVALVGLILFGMVGCQGVPTAEQSGGPGGNANDAGGTTTQPITVHVASLKGPTSIGLVSFIDKAKNNPGSLTNSYDFTVFGTGGTADTVDAILAGLVSNSTDIALVPANLAATLYNQEGVDIQVLDINTLGVLHVVSADASVNSLADLAGRTVLTTGKGATPEYVLSTLLAANGVQNVNLEFKSEATELAAALVSDPTAIAVLPEPYVTAVTSQDPSLTPRIDLTDAWNNSMADGSQLVTSVTIVRSGFAAEHPQAVQEFLEQQRLSVDSVNADPAAAAQLVVASGIIEKAAVAELAIPRCNLVCVTGADAKTYLNGYLAALFAQNPASVGGKLPADDFYYPSN